MKKIKYCKFILLLLFIFVAFLSNNKVYGYNLKYKAYLNDDEVEIITMGNTYKDPPDGVSLNTFIKATTDNNNFCGIVDKSRNEVNVAFSGSYQTYKLLLSNETLSNYGAGQEYTMGYDFGNLNVSDNGDIKDVTNAVGWVGYKNTNQVSSSEIELNGIDFKVLATMYKNANDQDRPSQTITITKWGVLKSKLEDLLKNKPEWFTKTKDGEKYIYASLSAVTAGPSSEKYAENEAALAKERDKGNENHPNVIIEYWKNVENNANINTWKDTIDDYYYRMDTAYDAIKVVFNTNLWRVNRGLATLSTSKSVDSPSLAQIGQSIMNLYDNQLYIPQELTEPQEVYIRHVDEEGYTIDGIENSQETKIDSAGRETIIINDNKNNEHSRDYQEYYKIGLNDKLRASRSLTYADSTYIYKYSGYEMVNQPTFDAANVIVKADKSSNKGTNIDVETKTSDKKNVTIITFKYSKQKITPDPDDPNKKDRDPKGGVKTITGTSTDPKSCETVYTPTGEDISPYLIANKYLLKDLKYNLVQDGDKVKYEMTNFNVNMLSSGEISDNDTFGSSTRGKIFGKDPWTLLDGGSPQNISLSQNISTPELEKFKTDFGSSLPNTENVNTLLKGEKTLATDFNTSFKIPTNKYNGIRTPKLTALYTGYDVIHNSYNNNEVIKKDASNTINVIVYNPLELGEISVSSEGVVDHTTTNTTTNVIQKNAKFTVDFGTKGSSKYASITDTSKYLDHYYMIFDIDIVLQDTREIRTYNGSGFGNLEQKQSGDIVKAGTLIKINKDQKQFTALASSSSSKGDIVSQIQNNVVLIGVSNNMPDSALENTVFKNAVRKYSMKVDQVEEKYINTDKTTNEIDFDNYCDENHKENSYHEAIYTKGQQMYDDSYYFAMAKAVTTNIGRIYDFELTDCSDIDYKSVFRINENANVNKLSGVRYFSGVKWFNIYTDQVNTLEDRANLNIDNTSAKKILPLGPYKSTVTSYVNAPKLGYRISFDLKTSGYFNYKLNTTSTREILIKPTYYFISKDGNTLVEDINLYYKNSDGKYENFVGSNYTIYFKPNDGYRYIYNNTNTPNISNMSSKLEPLNVGCNNTEKGFTLNSSMMSVSDNQFIQAWYGEFKLPNSTIAVNGSDISNPLTNGYIGVKFDIECIDDKGKSTEKRISYNQLNKNDKDSSGNLKPNTTQWDYEGFLGFTNYGNEANDLTLQLEKGTWSINNEKYNKIKGTVVLFDTDNRAANDFD